METVRIERLIAGGRELEFFRIPARRTGLPELIFLHEGLGSLALWRGFPAALVERTGCGAIVYSRCGNGFSAVVEAPRDVDYMHHEALVVLPEVLQSLRVGNTVLVGHSDGASIALLYAAEHPANLRGLVLEAPHVFVEDVSIQSIAAIKTKYESTDLRGRIAKHHTDGDRTFYGWNDIWLDPRFRSWNITSYVDRVIAPAFAIQGLDDEYGTVAQIDAMTTRSSGQVDSLLLARCGHAPHRDRLEIVLGAAAAWLAEKLLD